MSPPQNWSDHELDIALGLLVRGQPDQAIPLLTSCVQHQPGQLAAVRALATAHMATQEPAAARRVLADYTGSFPMCEQGWRLAALLEWKLGQREAGIAILNRGLDRLPNSVVLRRQLATFKGALGVADKPPAETPAPSAISAPDWLDRLVQDSKMLEGVLNTAGDAPDREMLQSIEQRLSRLLEAQPSHPDRQVILAKIRIRLDDLPGAMVAAQRALRANPMYVQAHRLRADIATRMGDDESAIQTLESLVGRGVHWPDLHCQIAEIQQRRGDLEKARSHLWQALSNAPGYQKARELLARCAA